MSRTTKEKPILSQTLNEGRVQRKGDKSSIISRREKERHITHLGTESVGIKYTDRKKMPT